MDNDDKLTNKDNKGNEGTKVTEKDKDGKVTYIDDKDKDKDGKVTDNNDKRWIKMTKGRKKMTN